MLVAQLVAHAKGSSLVATSRVASQVPALSPTHVPLAGPCKHPALQTPGMLATPGYQNASEVTDRSQCCDAQRMPVSPTDTSSGMLATPDHQNANQVFPGFFPQAGPCMPLSDMQTPGMLATPGHQNASLERDLHQPPQAHDLPLPALSNSEALLICHHERTIRYDNTLKWIAEVHQMISHEGEAMPASEAITPVQARSTDLADIGTGSAILPSRKAEPGMQCSHDRAKSVGAVPGFETRKRTSMFDVPAGKKHNHDQIPHAMIAHKHVDSGLPVQSAHSPAGPCEVSFTQEMLERCQEIEKQDDANPASTTSDHATLHGSQHCVSPSHEHAKPCEHAPECMPSESISANVPQQMPCNPTTKFWILRNGHQPQLALFTGNPTVGQLACAEAALGSMTQPIRTVDALGNQIPIATVLREGQVVMLQEAKEYVRYRCPLTAARTTPQFQGDTRVNLLWQQGPWIADDEMRHYMHMIEAAFPQVQAQSFVIHDEVDGLPNLFEYIVQIAQYPSATSKATVLAVLCQAHWFPVVILHDGTAAQVWTTPAEATLFRTAHSAADSADVQITHHTSPIPHKFDADCGYQTVGWLISMLLDHPTDDAWTPEQACLWRMHFHYHLVTTGRSETLIMLPLVIGGTLTELERLQSLLEEHGVNQTRSKECAEQLIKTFGITTIQKILKSPKAWTDLKARANLHSPPIRLVLAEELKTMVLARMQDNRPVGSKQNKAAHRKQQTKPLRLQAEQIQVPFAVFKQDDGAEVGQIQAHQLGPTSRGVLVMNIEAAIPYFTLQSPLSQEGVALLILEASDSRIPECHTKVKVPVQCQETQEPIIITVAILQVGTKVISRNVPANCLEIEEVPNEVVRIAIFQDQFPGSWQDIVAKPVKTMLACRPFDELEKGALLDVWDRQFLSDKMQKTKPENAHCFMVNLRVTTDAAKIIHANCGSGGMYSEPRSHDGRQTNAAFQVVWLLQKSYAQATVAQQTTKVPAALVRAGARYGLRVLPTDAEQVHSQHRPDLPFLQGDNLRKFRIGPLPYGTSKASISQICKQWQWNARPISPNGQSPDKAGVLWILQASEDPSHWVYQLAHGDVLITPIETARTAESPQVPVLASAKTLHKLKQGVKDNVADESTEDPWAHYDPWQ